MSSHHGDDPVVKHESINFELTTHVTMDFHLWQDGKQAAPTQAQSNAISALFPTCFAVAAAPPFLVVRVKALPPKPWPVTVAGLPLYLTTDANEGPMDLGTRAQGPKLSISADLGLWKTPNREAFILIFEEFAKLGASVDRVQWFGIGFKVLAASEPYNDWKSRLPSFINNLFVGYAFGEDFGDEKALRKKEPEGAIHDDETYDILRPGVKLYHAAHEAKDDLKTTSGVCVQSPHGTKYITVAKYGFPSGVDTEVWHPHKRGRLVGQISKVFGETDVALCQLTLGLPYSRETFTTTDSELKIGPFQALADMDTIQLGSLVYMDTPYTGRVEGTLMVKEVLRLPQDEPADDTQYAICIYAYFGNGNDTLGNRCCGGVIWDDNLNVLGQFRFRTTEKSGWCYCPTFDNLRRLGYRLSQA